MYELLLKWGLETFRKASIKQTDQEFSVMLEAIKTKNILVVERFRYAWSSCQDIVRLAVRVEEMLPEFLLKARQTDGTVQSVKNFLGDLRSDFHPQHYRELTKLRCQFEATNDLLAAYSGVFVDVLHYSVVGEISKKKKLFQTSDIIRLYRGLWLFYTRILTSLLRITSSDLRFWITEKPYIIKATEWAEKDWVNAKEYLLQPEGQGIKYRLSLENPEKFNVFWDFLSEESD